MQGKDLGLMLQARNLMLPKVGYTKQYVFLLLINKVLLQLIKDDTYECLKITSLQNISWSWEQLCACVCVLGKKMSIGNVLVFPYELLVSKGKR